MPQPKFKVLLNIANIEAACRRKGWTATDLCYETGLDPKTLLPSIDWEKREPATIRTLKRLHQKLGGDIASLTLDPLTDPSLADTLDPRVNERFPKRDIHVVVRGVRPTAKNLALAEKVFHALAFALEVGEDDIEYYGARPGSILLICGVWDASIPKVLQRLRDGYLKSLKQLRKAGDPSVKHFKVDAIIFPSSTCEARPTPFAHQFFALCLEESDANRDFSTWEEFIHLAVAQSSSALRASGRPDGSIMVARSRKVLDMADRLDTADMQPGEQRPSKDGIQVVSKQRILIVDDRPDSAAEMAEILTSVGYEARIAYDGFEAVEVAASFHPRVVILNILLPGMDGYETGKRIREQSPHEKIVLVAKTNYAMVGDKQEALAGGFDDCLTEPVEPEALERTVKAFAPLR
jgi:CheY-like chemotaxis protein